MPEPLWIYLMALLYFTNVTTCLAIADAFDSVSHDRASITASATFGHSASPDSVTCWHIMDCNEPCRIVSSVLTFFVIATRYIPSTYRYI